MPPNANKEIYDLSTPIQRIRAKMQAQHVSQQDLCDWLHMSSSSVSRLLQGESTLTFDAAVAISQHLGMSLDEIAGHSSSNDQHNIDAVINLYENRLTAVRATIMQDWFPKSKKRMRRKSRRCANATMNGTK